MVPTGSLLWSPHGPHVLHPWSPLGPHLVPTWSPPGRHASPVRGPCGNHVGDPVVTRCGPGGYQAGTTWGPRVDQVAGHHLVPTWIQLGPHLVPRPPPGSHLVPTSSPPRPHMVPIGTTREPGRDQAGNRWGAGSTCSDQFVLLTLVERPLPPRDYCQVHPGIRHG